MAKGVVLECRCFGALKIFVCGEWVKGPSPTHGGTIISYFLTYQDEISAEALGEIISPLAEGDAAMDLVYTGVSAANAFLSQTLGGAKFIQRLHNLYRLNPNVLVASDRSELRGCYRERTVVAAERGIPLYTGKYLAHISDYWVLWPRAEAEREYCSLLELLATDAWEARNYELTIDRAFRLLQRDGGDENATRLMMRAHLELQRPARALECCEVARRWLSERNGILSPETEALRTEIVEGRRPSSMPVSQTLPRSTISATAGPVCSTVPTRTRRPRTVARSELSRVATE